MGRSWTDGLKTAKLQDPPGEKSAVWACLCVKMRSKIVLLKYASCVKLRNDGVAKWAARTESQKLWNGENVRPAFPRNQWYFYRWVSGTSAEEVQMQSAANQCLHPHLTGSRCFTHLQPGSQKYLFTTIIWSLQLTVITHTTFPAAACSTAHAVCTS